MSRCLRPRGHPPTPGTPHAPACCMKPSPTSNDAPMHSKEVVGKSLKPNFSSSGHAVRAAPVRSHVLRSALVAAGSRPVTLHVPGRTYFMFFAVLTFTRWALRAGTTRGEYPVGLGGE